MTDVEAIRSLLHLYRSDDGADEGFDAEGSRGSEATSAETSQPLPLVLTAASSRHEPGLSGDWPSAIRLVERAANTIREYEQRFRAIEVDARAFIQRVDEEQGRLQAQIGFLESSLADAEERATRADTSLQEAKLEEWEARLFRKSAELRAATAEAELKKSAAYMKRLTDILEKI